MQIAELRTLVRKHMPTIALGELLLAAELKTGPDGHILPHILKNVRTMLATVERTAESDACAAECTNMRVAIAEAS